VPVDQMLDIDRWALATYAAAADRIVQAYDDYDYPAVYQAANALITTDLSAFYVDVTKDRMYTTGATSTARRSGQTAMFFIVEGLSRLLAPILSVTMDELWHALPGERLPSVHLALFPMGDELATWRDTDRLERWARLRTVRDEVNLALEQRRQEQLIKGNLSAQIVMHTSGDELALLEAHRDFLPTLFGVSAVALHATTDGRARQIEVQKADGHKCERCWRSVPEVSSVEATDGLCPRCVEALTALGAA
jgi:isoleucyl-tRNA synthetase